MRAAIYARYSSANQRDASIVDQVRICKAHIKRESWSLVGTYTDHARSGATTLRPGYQKLLEDARAGSFDIVLAEGLDRLSRDQEDIAGLYKQLSFAGIKIVTLAEGEISELHVGLKGTMNALYLKDLAQKTWRGLEGRVRQGRSGGGLCFGYDVVREMDERGEFVFGGRKVNDEEAAIVCRVFKEYSAGSSPRAIAKGLNSDGVPGPRGKTWSDSTIHGNWRRGTGTLNNELYVGRLVWNRQRFVRDPNTGRRVARLNPESEWVVQDVPELRIVSQDLWEGVKERQQEKRHLVERTDASYGLNEAHRKRYLLSGLIRCGLCQGAYTIVSTERYGCANHRNRGTCSNALRIHRNELEDRVLAGLKSKLMAPELVEEFIREYHAELNRLRAAEDAKHTASNRERDAVQRKIDNVMGAIESGIFTETTKDRLIELEARRKVLERQPAPKKAPRLHPKLAEVYRQNVENLRVALNRPDTRGEAAQILGDLIDEVRLTPEEDGSLKAELFGDLAAMLAYAQHEKKSPDSDKPGRELSLVAGARYGTYLTPVLRIPLVRAA